MIKPTTLSEQMLFCTVRIKAQLSDGSISIGTGFFFDFSLDDKMKIPVIITNKHVIKNAVKGKFQLHEAKITDRPSEPSGRFFTVVMDQFEGRWLLHPDDMVDLCAMPFQPLQVDAELKNKSIFRISLDSNLILTDSALKELSAVEDILMVGYPIGLWDEINNLPLIRRGITSTHPSIDFCGKSVCVIDVACFPGSSGSPVLIVNECMYSTKTGAQLGSSRAILLGVLFAGPQITAEGQIVIQDIPTGKHPFSVTKLMIHLGYIVKAKEVLTLGEHIKKVLQANGSI